MERPPPQDDYSKFGGMVSSVDPHDIQAGQATLQLNGTAVRPGELNVRRGLAPVEFEDE